MIALFAALLERIAAQEVVMAEARELARRRNWYPLSYFLSDIDERENAQQLTK